MYIAVCIHPKHVRIVYYMSNRFPLYSSASLLGVFLLAATGVTTSAQVRTSEPITLQRIEGEVTLDGLSNEEAWDSVEPLELTVYQPVYKGEAAQKTEIRIGYDDEFLYLAGRMYDSDPSNIRGNSLYRDQYAGDDTFSLLIDTFNDNENMLWFSTTPTGVRFDRTVANDGEIITGFQGTVNSSWNTFWDAVSEITDEGWFSEMRIPFSSLRFQDENGQVVIGLTVHRFIARLNERHIFPDTPPNWFLGWAKASMAQDVMLNDVFSKKPVYITPYVSGGSTFANTLNDEETEFASDNDFTREAGLDLKYNLSSNLTMDLSVNTDFAQVEADDEQVNLTRLSLFFPEKRQFFQERAAIFDFATGRVDRLFYSRRIGLDDDGNPVRILGGARVVGRLGSWDLGFLNMQTANSTNLPSENFGVLRLRRKFLNEYSYAGGLLTSRLSEQGAYNVGIGLDAVVRPFGNEYATLRVASTLDDEVNEGQGTNNLIKASLLRAQWERRTNQGFSYGILTKRYGPTYNPELGFITRENIWANRIAAGYGWLGSESDWFRRIGSEFSTSFIARNEDGSIESSRAGIGSFLEFKEGSWIEVALEYQYEDLQEEIEFPEETSVPEGSYRFTTLQVGRMASNSRLLSMDGQFFIGTFYDGWRMDVGLGPEWAISKHVLLEAEYELNVVRFPDRDQQFDSHVLRFRSQFALNTKVSLASFIQFSTASDFITTNLRFRYNFREGNDLWLVFNQGNNLDRERDFNFDRNRPIYPRIANRTLLLKYTYTFGS